MSITKYVKYILNYITVINQLLVLSVLKKWKRLSRIQEFNSCLWSPKLLGSTQRYQLHQLSYKLELLKSCSRAIYHTLYTTPASRV